MKQLPLLDTTPRASAREPAEPAPIEAASTKSARPRRLLAVPAADQLARRGACVCVVLQDDGATWEVGTVRDTETAPAWRELVAKLAKGGRVRLYDRSPRCVWDSADGGTP